MCINFRQDIGVIQCLPESSVKNLRVWKEIKRRIVYKPSLNQLQIMSQESFFGSGRSTWIMEEIKRSLFTNHHLITFRSYAAKVSSEADIAT